MEPIIAFVLGILCIALVGAAIQIGKKLLPYWPLFLILGWYTFSAIHIRWYYLNNWYAPEHHFKEGEGNIWAIVNWIFSPVATPVWYVYKLLDALATHAFSGIDSVLRWIGAI